MLGKIVILLALVAAGWILIRASKGRPDDARGMFRLKVVGLLAVAAVCFASNLFPVALMILIAAGGVTAIELWSGRAIKGLEDMAPGAGTGSAAPLKAEEAAAILGVAIDATEDDVKAAHKKLIGQLHPDKGGTDYLAAKVNDARRVMLERLSHVAPTGEAKG